MTKSALRSAVCKVRYGQNQALKSRVCLCAQINACRHKCFNIIIEFIELYRLSSDPSSHTQHATHVHVWKKGENENDGRHRCPYRAITALDAVDASVVEFGRRNLQRVEIAVHAVTVTLCDAVP